MVRSKKKKLVLTEREVQKDSGKKFKFCYAEIPNVICGKSEVTFENQSGRILKI